MKRHFVIESRSALEAVRNASSLGEFRDGDEVWWTTAPGLLAELEALGLDVRSPEEGLPFQRMDALAEAGYDFADILSEKLNGVCGWRDGYSVGRALRTSVGQCFFITCYKGLLLSRVLDERGPEDGPVICVGDARSICPQGLSVMFDRFDTLFALIASRAGKDEIVYSEHKIGREDLKRIDNAVRYRKLSGTEKVLSILHNTASSVFFKIWKNLRQRKFYPFPTIRLYPKSKVKMFIYKHCELIDEAFLSLLLGGAQVGTLDAIGNINYSDGEAFEGIKGLGELCAGIADAVFKKHDIQCDLFRECIEIFVERLERVLTRLHRALPDLEVRFEQMLGKVDSNSVIMSNFLTGVEESLFVDHVKERGVPFIGFEHGVTLGLSGWSSYSVRGHGLAATDAGIYHTQRALEDMQPQTRGQQTLLAGVPETMRRVRPYGLSRSLARRWLGIGRDEHVIMYVADLERNNFQMGPHLDNDLMFYRKTRAIVSWLVENVPSATVLLKTYPTQRYVDRYEFDDLALQYPNVRIVKDKEYRFVRAASDLTVVTSSMSTLGWAMGGGAPVLFLEFAWAPVRFGGLGFDLPEISGVRRAIMPGQTDILGDRHRGWPRELRDLARRLVREREASNRKGMED